jgi:predicted ribosome quality control (RQC) complex YloA/Tae2 family protein
MTPAISSRPHSRIDASARFLGERVRGDRLDARRRAALAEARRESRRLSRLLAHLEQDLAGLPDADSLRRHGEALLAAPSAVAPGASEAAIPDPHAPETLLRVSLDPRLSAPSNADRLFGRARRVERSRLQIEARLAETRRALDEARAREARALEARDLADIETVRSRSEEPSEGAGAGRTLRHYLTSRGLSLLVGRGARENHHLTFAVARPEDLWFHARDVPGAHAILRDNEGRAVAEDLREAAEVAAFFSDARGHAKVDVHVTRRKHVRPVRGGMGRVHVSHSDTLRVAPRDPEGRLRRR